MRLGWLVASVPAALDDTPSTAPLATRQSWARTRTVLPSFLDSDVQLDPADLSRLQVREIVSTVRFRVYRHYTLTAGSTVLMRKFTDEARVAYAARRIADIVDRPVEVVRL